MTFLILPLLSVRYLDIGPKGFSPRDAISRGLMTREIWKRPCINQFITYFSRADNMLFPFTRGQITCYCPRKMIFPRRQITRRKLCFYYTYKFGVISIKNVIMFIQRIILQSSNICYMQDVIYCTKVYVWFTHYTCLFTQYWKIMAKVFWNYCFDPYVKKYMTIVWTIFPAIL